MDEEGAPLLERSTSCGQEEEEEKSSKKNDESAKLQNMVLFHGKELAGKSFIRSPHYNLVRIGISREGIHKVDGSTPKILAHWKFREIRDSSYSGFSFTLQFKGGKSDYSVRTDDGEAICSYIEEFQKNPDKALEKALTNPPVSNVPESGLMTLRRKFSGANTETKPEVKFYTLNRKSAKRTNTQDPYSKLAHNIEVDSRLRNRKPAPLNGNDLENRRSYSFEPSGPVVPTHSSGNGTQYHSAIDIPSSAKLNGGVAGKKQEKQLARAVLSQCIKQAEEKEKEKRKQLNPSPVSTKGEVTMTESTHSPSSAPSPPANKRWSSNSPHMQRKALPSHVTEFSKAGSAPPCLPPGAGAGGDSSPGGEESVSLTKAQGMKQLNTVGKWKSPPTLIVSGKKERPPAPDPLSPSDDHAPLIRQSSNTSSSGLCSPTDEFTFVPAGGSGNGWGKRPISGSSVNTGSGSGTGTGSLSRSGSGSNQNYDHLDELMGRRHDSWESFGTSSSSSPAPSMFVSRPPEGPLSPGRGSQSSSPHMSHSSSNESGIYDHLPPSGPPVEEVVGVALLEVLPPKRNISQPALSTPTSARESPCDQFGRFGSIDEESSGEELGDTPTNSDEESAKREEGAGSEAGVTHEGVVLRQKKRQQHLEDPFADLMSPKASSRLRWSQELNPLYDYIKGFKVEGVRLYDSSPVSKLLQSTSAGNSAAAASLLEAPLGKPPSVILEDEEDILSLNASDTQSLGSQDISQSPISPSPSSCSSFGEGDTLSIRSRRQHQQHNYEDVEPLPRRTLQSHNYEDILSMPTSACSMPSPPSPIATAMETSVKRAGTATGMPPRNPADRLKQKQGLKASTVTNLETPMLQRFREINKTGVSPRLGKRAIVQQQRRSRAHDDSETAKSKQRPMRAADALKDFAYVMREFRIFFVKLPNGYLSREIFNINKPVSELRDRLCDYLGIDHCDKYQLVVEGACLSTLKESETGAEVVRVNRVGLNYLADSQILIDQGTDAITLKSNLSLRMQGISTSRILALRPVAVEEDDTLNTSFNPDPPSDEDEYYKCWISVVQGNHPLQQDKAVKLAALQYQAYFLDRTAVNSVVGFSRPTEFLPVEYSNVRGIEQKMYKEQESFKKKSHTEIEDAYIDLCSQLESYDAVFFPAREPRKKLLQSTKLKPVIFGVGPRGILRVDPKTKELLGFWHYNVLKNWAYSKRTFVLAFRDKSFPVESNQAKWISSLVDYFVDSLIINVQKKVSLPQQAS